MKHLEHLDDRLFIFGSLFILANSLDTTLERSLKEFDITSKQWLLCIIIDNLFSSPPTIKEVASASGSSHQNVKQVALKLSEKGLLTLKKDDQDARVTRLVMTEKSKEFWRKTDPKGTEFMKQLFEGTTAEELSKTRAVIVKLLSALDKMEGKKD